MKLHKHKATPTFCDAYILLQSVIGEIEKDNVMMPQSHVYNTYESQYL